jgi:hypothetical protein
MGWLVHILSEQHWCLSHNADFRSLSAVQLYSDCDGMVAAIALRGPSRTFATHTAAVPGCDAAFLMP